jgi:hypothetical protein
LPALVQSTAPERGFVVAGGRRVHPKVAVALGERQSKRRKFDENCEIHIQGPGVQPPGPQTDVQTTMPIVETTTSPAKGNPSAASPAPASGYSVARTNSDAKSLLLELARALRGFSFYDETAPQRRPLVDRAYRALAGELTRAGPLEFEDGPRDFQVSGLSQPIEAGNVLAPLQSALRMHRLQRVRLEPALTRNALHGFFALLGQSQSRFENPEGFVRSLEARDARGIQLNGIHDPDQTTTPKLGTTPPRASASLSARPVAAERHPENPTLETHPLDVPSAHDAGERLRARLIELDRLTDDDAYRQLAGDVTIWAQELFNKGFRGDCYRALLVLADHAVGIGGRTEGQARIAANCFAQLANGERLDDLIARATDSIGTDVRAAQLLLQLGASAAPAIFNHICEEQNVERALPLRSLVLALGDESLPILIKAIDSHDDRRAHKGIRLAGELQNPAVLPALVTALRRANASRRDEIIRALGFLPGEDSKRALAVARRAGHDEIERPA